MNTTLQSLLTVQERPFNAETPLGALLREITPTPLFYVRSNFDLPVIDAATWRIQVGGLVGRPRSIGLAELREFPRREITATIECAGNGRKLMQPVPAGTAWDLGAVSTGTFAGVSLRDVLAACDVDPGALEVVFEGADQGRVEGDRHITFARSLPLERALHEDTLLAWEMNGEPLTPNHGYPVRLFVPGWYGVASVKWLTRITAVNEPFDGHFQAERYIYNGHPDYPAGTPVTLMHVRALIANPLDGGGTRAGRRTMTRGIAWSGFAPVARVQLSIDGGSSWQDTELAPAVSPYAARQWTGSFVLPEPGEYELMVRAEDESGRVQPLEPIWNELGYGNNVAQRIRITAE